MTDTQNHPQPRYVLTLDRVLDAPVEKVWRCWTEPELLEQWFCPKPWFVTDAVMDLKPGGEFSNVMHGPDGERVGNVGIFLAVEPMKRLVSTDAFLPGWIPAEQAFMVADTAFADAGKCRTRYIARALHWTEEAMKGHEAMGFHEGWGMATNQLEALAKTL